jgi:hypothetical protein
LLALAWGCSQQRSESPTQPAATPATNPSTQPTTRRVENHDEGQAWYWVLPNPLVMSDGRPVRDAQTWLTRRRPEILALFQSEVYGKAPGRPVDESFEVFDNDPHALGGKAVRKQISVHLGAVENAPKIDILLYLPAKAVKPVPVFLCFSFYPLQRVMDDPGIRLQDEWDRYHQIHHPGRMRQKSPWFQIEETLDRGYGFAAIYYQQIDPDFAGALRYGVRSAYLEPGQSDVRPDQWGTIAAWAWGASRAMDYLQTDPQVDHGRIAIMGHSRLGKTALWVGATDERFALVFPCSSGRGGASLARRNFGESVGDLNQHYAYQFCDNYCKYGRHVTDLPVDTHELIGLVAPRPIYLATASLDLHSDPRGEFDAAVAAGPIYRLLGKQDLGTDVMPPVDTPIMLGDIGFHCRAGRHEVTAWDWKQILAFADRKFASAGR